MLARRLSKYWPSSWGDSRGTPNFSLRAPFHAKKSQIHYDEDQRVQIICWAPRFVLVTLTRRPVSHKRAQRRGGALVIGTGRYDYDNGALVGVV